MHLYHLTVHHPDLLTDAVKIKLDGKNELLVLAKGEFLEIISVDDEGGELLCLDRLNCRSVISRLVVVPQNGIEELNVFTKRGLLKYNHKTRDFTCVDELIVGEYCGYERALFAIEINGAYSAYFNETKTLGRINAFIYNMEPVYRGPMSNPSFVVLQRTLTKSIALYELNASMGVVSKVWSVDFDGVEEFIFINEFILVFTKHELHKLDLNGNLVSKTSIDFPKFVTKMQSRALVQFENETVLLDTDFNRTSVQNAPPMLSFWVAFDQGFVFTSGKLNNMDHKLLQITSFEPNVELELLTSYPRLSPVVSAYAKNGVFLIGGVNSVKRLKFGRYVEELASTPLPAKPKRILTARKRFSDETDSYILLCFEKSTTVLEVGEEGGVNEVSETVTGIAGGLETLYVRGMHSGLVQIHPKGLRYISTKPMPWVISATSTRVVAAAVEGHRVVLGLSDKSVVYFEERNDMLMESQKRLRLTSDIIALSLDGGSVCVGLSDETVRVFELSSNLQTGIHSLQFGISSLLTVKDKLYVGHVNGTVSIIGEDDVHVRVVGAKPVSLNTLNKGVLALSFPRAFMFLGNTENLQQLQNCDNLTSAFNFTTDNINGMVGIRGSELRVMRISEDGLNTGVCLETLADTVSPVIGFVDRNLAISKTSIVGIGESTIELPKVNAFVACKLKQKDCIAVSANRKILIYTGNELLHETIVDGDCSALLGFQGMLLAAIRNRLVLFDLGQKQLLFQTEFHLLNANKITVMKTMRDLVYVGDSRDSVTFLNYKNNTFTTVARDYANRSVSTMVILDIATVCIGDHYGNISVLRSPQVTPPSQSHCMLELIAHFWVPDAIVQVHRTTISPTAAHDSIVYFGLHGTIGVLTPFVSDADHKSFYEIEQEFQDFNFRNVYTPKRNCVDGDLCEVGGITSKLASMRARC